jgi:hypothetical protein
MNRYRTFGLKSVAGALTLALAASACSSNTGEDDDSGGGNVTGKGGSTSVGTGGTPNGQGGTPNGLGGTPNGLGGSGNRGGATGTTGGAISSGTGGGSSQAPACKGVPYTGSVDMETGKMCGVEFEQEAVRKPVDMFIMMDRSSSMLYTVPNSNPQVTRWSAFQAGMEDFVAAASKQDLRAGINFFGLSKFGGEDLDCSVPDYATPKVEIAQVADNGADLIAAIVENQPAGLTPTLPALQGALQHTKDWIASGKNEGRAVVTVLVTDGYPTQCQSPVSIKEIADVAKDAFDNQHIRTFVIGLAAGFNLDTIAQAGGTVSATLLDEDEPTSDLVDALINITDSKIACDYDIPVPPDGTEFIQDKVQVIFTPMGSAEEEIPRIDSASACGVNPNGGWYFDSPTNPKQIRVCPCTCSRINQAGSVRISLGCEPVPGIR